MESVFEGPTVYLLDEVVLIKTVVLISPFSDSDHPYSDAVIMQTTTTGLLMFSSWYRYAADNCEEGTIT